MMNKEVIAWIKRSVYLVEFPDDFFGPKLFKEAPELQCVDGHDLCAPSLPPISETNHRFTFLD